MTNVISCILGHRNLIVWMTNPPMCSRHPLRKIKSAFSDFFIHPTNYFQMASIHLLPYRKIKLNILHFFYYQNPLLWKIFSKMFSSSKLFNSVGLSRPFWIPVFSDPHFYQEGTGHMSFSLVMIT